MPSAGVTPAGSPTGDSAARPTRASVTARPRPRPLALGRDVVRGLRRVMNGGFGHGSFPHLELLVFRMVPRVAICRPLAAALVLPAAHVLQARLENGREIRGGRGL